MKSLNKFCRKKHVNAQNDSFFNKFLDYDVYYCMYLFSGLLLLRIEKSSQGQKFYQGRSLHKTRRYQNTSKLVYQD